MHKVPFSFERLSLQRGKAAWGSCPISAQAFMKLAKFSGVGLHHSKVAFYCHCHLFQWPRRGFESLQLNATTIHQILGGDHREVVPTRCLERVAIACLNEGGEEKDSSVHL